MKITIFAGPTLPESEIAALVDAEVLPPAARGDIYCAARAGAQAIGVIDGYFACVAAPWHKEILYAMSEGCAVFGASSMGALRAAELASFGMMGVGQIFRAFASEDLTDDDEVALVHAPREDAYRPLSEPMVNIRATVARALLEGIVDEALADAVLRCAKAMHYAERSYRAVLSKLERDGGAERLGVFGRWLPQNAVNQKKLDAIELCHSLARFGDSDAKALPVSYNLEHTDSWANARRHFDVRSQTSVEDQSVLEELRILGQVSSLEDAALARNLSARFGSAEQSAFADLGAEQLAEEHDLAEHSELTRWLETQGLAAASKQAFLHRHGRLMRMKELTRVPARFDLLDELRAKGRYAALRQRALRKAKLLADSRGGMPQLSGEALCAWYCQLVLGTRNKSSDQLAKQLGFANTPEFERAARREYAFRLALGGEFSTNEP